MAQKEQLKSLLLQGQDLIHKILKESFASEELRIELIEWRNKAEQALENETF